MPEARARSGGLATLGLYAAGLLSWWLYNHADAAVANRVILLYATCLLGGPSLIYALQRRSGAGEGRAAVLALGVPGLWLAKELYRVTGVHPLAESLYYALNPVAVGVFAAALVPMAAIEVGSRRRRGCARALAGWPGLTLGGFAALAIASAAVGHDNGGRAIFYAYVRLYRWLFAG